jgi:hypothetical protein
MLICYRKLGSCFGHCVVLFRYLCRNISKTSFSTTCREGAGRANMVTHLKELASFTGLVRREGSEIPRKLQRAFYVSSEKPTDLTNV